MTESKDKKIHVHGDMLRDEKVSLGDYASSSSIAIGRGSQAYIQQARYGDDVADLFLPIYRQVETREGQNNQEELTFMVRRLEEEVSRRDEVDLGKIERWLQMLASAAPDVFDVTRQALTQPAAPVIAGVRHMAEKVAAAEPRAQVPIAEELEAQLRACELEDEKVEEVRADLTQLQVAASRGSAEDVRLVRSMLPRLVAVAPKLRQPLWDWLVETPDLPTPIRVIARKTL